MKKISILSLMAFSLLASGAYAQKKKSVHDQLSGQGYGTAGCGLGSMIFGSKPGLVQVFASTTNGTSGTQTFGISSGTSNCDSPAGGASAAIQYIEANRVALANDIARGFGETVADLADIYGCEDSAQVGQLLQKNFEKIFPQQNAPANNVENSIKALLSESELCGTLG